MKRVLSIQSHVVHGYVGGKSAIFPLQSQGWDVDYINSVHFSNHTGYGSFVGNKLTTMDLNLILDQLINKMQIKYNAILSGYIPNSDLISCLGSYIKELKTRDPEIFYLLDPVMGDNDYLYVDKSCIEEYKKLMIEKIVNLITPNQFEVELITGIKIIDKTTLKEAISKLHKEFNIPLVVISSIKSGILNNDDSFISCILSVNNEIKYYNIPIINSYFTGVGDLFSALLLDKWFLNSNITDNLQRLSKSINQVLTIMNKTLNLTHKMGLELASKEGLNGDVKNLQGKINDGKTMKYFELKVIQSKEFFSYSDDGEFEELSLD
ncbi:BUD16 [Candida pseudojiufengensis]|uniref:BUD16 n=1 Tax=Candida pseudojiufengensis TaxID=497109 RepID=UPI002224FA3A|nr:BUD16 [Candida pseudojiufengensis]KAI5966377.1 BUD16 [Candida pseudojiufengensis]